MCFCCIGSRRLSDRLANDHRLEHMCNVSKRVHARPHECTFRESVPTIAWFVWRRVHPLHPFGFLGQSLALASDDRNCWSLRRCPCRRPSNGLGVPAVAPLVTRLLSRCGPPAGVPAGVWSAGRCVLVQAWPPPVVSRHCRPSVCSCPLTPQVAVLLKAAICDFMLGCARDVARLWIESPLICRHQNPVGPLSLGTLSAEGWSSSRMGTPF